MYVLSHDSFSVLLTESDRQLNSPDAVAPLGGCDPILAGRLDSLLVGARVAESAWRGQLTDAELKTLRDPGPETGLGIGRLTLQLCQVRPAPGEDTIVTASLPWLLPIHNIDGDMEETSPYRLIDENFRVVATESQGNGPGGSLATSRVRGEPLGSLRGVLVRWRTIGASGEHAARQLFVVAAHGGSTELPPAVGAAVRDMEDRLNGTSAAIPTGVVLTA